MTMSNGVKEYVILMDRGGTFPPMSDEAFAALVADIRENGLREAIVLYEGKILDGRNRYRACTEVGIEPITKQWDQRGDALSFVVSKNLHRGHLNESQRGMVAAKIATLRRGGDRGNQYVGGKRPIGPLPQANAAALLNVSETSVARAPRSRHQSDVSPGTSRRPPCWAQDAPDSCSPRTSVATPFRWASRPRGRARR
jgi:hypothetical protein